MPSLSLKIILEDGAVTRTMKFPSGATVADAARLVQEKVLTGSAGKDYGLFLTSADDDLSGIWLEGHRKLDYYLLKNGDSLHYRCRFRTLKIRMLDDTVKTMQVDESEPVESVMMSVCGRLGITNYEEYGLCREDEPVEEHPSTGTLTLKRKPHREKDAAMQQLSKKLKTDDNVEWLEQHKTLRESSVAPTETLLLKRRLFYSDRSVDARDPVQLNLLYVQVRDAVLEGRHPVTEEQAVQFAGIQCQVQYGDYQEDKHKPGFIENLSEFLPQQYVSSWGVEKKVYKEHSKHQGVSQIDAKHLYTKTVRDLPTYGVTFFLVKEMQKDKKKLVPRLLGINANSVLRLDEETKEVLQVWPLTQIKTYKAGRGELFTLNFGDYSEKEYCVKTNDAYRIRDILQGYIDLIRKKMAEPFNASADEGGVIYTATVESCKGNVMEVVSHSAHKGVETSFVGPSRIINYEQGSKAQAQGAQIMTAQQIIVTSRQHNEQIASTGGVAMRTDISQDTVKRLNVLNGHAVSIVKLLTDPNEANIQEAKKIVAVIGEDMPTLVQGVKQWIEKQPDEPARLKLTLELNELCDNVKQLTDFRSPSEAQEAAMRIADLTTQMYFALDPRTRRRSEFLRRSRPSFIEDERTQATLQRASFVNCVAAANQAIDDAKDILNKEHAGPALSPAEVEALERSARDRLAKLNAAIALLAAAHSDPKNVDYSAAVNSINTIKKLMPELAKDAQALSCARDGQDRSALLQDMRELCDAAARICQTTGCDDPQKMHDEANNFARKSGRLVFTFGRGVHPDKENEIIHLTNEVKDKAGLLMATVNQLAGEVDDPSAPTVLRAVDKCAHAQAGLSACALLTASCLHEPHCRSALTAAVEDLSSSAQLLASSCRPLLEHPEGKTRSEAIKQQANELAKALERLKNAYGELDGGPQEDQSAGRERRRLQFISSAARAKEALDACQNTLDDNTSPVSTPGSWIFDSLPQRLGELNAAVAALAIATKDGANTDYETADAAALTIHKLMPEIINDINWYSRSCPKDKRDELHGAARDLCEALRALALNSAPGQDPNEAAAKYAAASGKLTYMFDRRANQEKEHQIIDLTKSACQQTSNCLAHVYGLAAEVGGRAGDELDKRGTDVSDVAQDLLTTAQVTSATVHTSPSKRALQQAARNLSSALEHLAACWPAATSQPQQLEEQRAAADEEIGRLLAALSEVSDHYEVPQDDPIKKKKRVRFALSLCQARDAVVQAEAELAKPLPSKPLSSEEVKVVQHSLAEKLAALNSAIAALVVATQDPANPDFEKAEASSAVIKELMPELIKDTKALSAGKSEEERSRLLEEIRALCAAAKDLSSAPREDNNVDVTEAAGRYALAARRLGFVCSPRTNKPDQQQEVVDKSRAACQRSVELAAALAHDSGSPGAHDGARHVLRAARALQSTAQLTAPSLDSSQCRAALLQAASELSEAVCRMSEACGSTRVTPEYRRAFEQAVEELMATIKGLEDDSEKSEREARRLKFVATRSAAHAALDKAAQELNKPLSGSSVPAQQAAVLQASLSDRLATLNAAIAALLAATRDAEKPNYATAESATATIQELIPDIVKDARILASGKDQPAQNSLLQNLRALCDATKDLTSGVHSGKEQKLNDDVAKFTNASGKLVYALNPHANPMKEDQIIDLTKSTCQKTSDLLSQVSTLAKQVKGATGSALDTRGTKVADAAQNLLTTAEITAPSITSPLCRSSFLTAAAALSSALEQLAVAWQPVTSQPAAQGLERRRLEVEEGLDGLRKALDSELVRGVSVGMEAIEADVQKRARLRFISSLASAEAAVEAAENELNEPCGAPLSPAAAASLQDSLANRLAALNAAINALVIATRDRENPDYAAAESAATTIRELVPDIVKDTKSISSSKEPAARDQLLTQLRALCEATRLLGATDKGPDAINEAATQYSLASGKLSFVFNPDTNQTKTHQIIDTCKSTCLKTSAMLQHVQALAKQAGRQGVELDRKGAAVSDAARGLLTTAQLTAHSSQSARCQEALLSAAERLSSSARELQTSWAAVLRDPRFKADGEQLANDKRVVDEEIEVLRGLVRDSKGHAANAKGDDPVLTRQKLRFVSSLKTTDTVVEDAQKTLDQPCGAPLASSAAAPLQDSLANRLAALNAAINALVVATADRDNPDYALAETASSTIRELLPGIVKDTKALSSSKDAAARDELLAQARELCDATRRLGAGAERCSPEELNEAASQYSVASNKLCFVYNPQVDQKKTHQIIDTCKAACVNTSTMLQHVQALATQAGRQGVELDRKGAAVSDAARGLLTTAQLTAHSSNTIPCQAALNKAADNLTSTVQELQATWSPIVKEPRFKVSGEQLAKDKEAVDQEIVVLKSLVRDTGKGVKGKQPPLVPARAGSLKPGSAGRSSQRAATESFLDNLRMEASKDNYVSPQSRESLLRVEEDKRDRGKFDRTVEDARKSIDVAELDLLKAMSSPWQPRASLDAPQTAALHKQMEHKLARVTASAAHLLQYKVSDGSRPDYKLASKCIAAVSDMVPTIVTDAKTLGDLKEEKERKAFLGDTLEFCRASKNLCHVARADRAKLTQAALNFGNQSSKLLYAVSTDIDPSQENEVLLRVKAVGDATCRLTEGGLEEKAATKCTNQATVFMYTAKLVAPSIQDSACQDTLITASKDLSTQLQSVTTSNPQLAQELAELEKTLEGLRSDVARGKLVKKRERLVLEDTPLRRLTAQVIEDAKQAAECTSEPPEQRRAMAAFANQLTDALNTLDLANARCNNAPHDMKKRADLEDAVLNLQQLVLQGRPRRGDSDAPQTNIVDLADFLSAVSEDAERLIQTASAPEMARGAHARAASAVTAQAQQLSAAATASATMSDSELAAKECARRVQKINTAIECCAEGPERTLLKKEARRLNESCTLLQFAAQSSLATSQCVALDEALDDLAELEAWSARMLQPRDGDKRIARTGLSPSLQTSRIRLATAVAGAGRDAKELVPAFTRYVADMRAHVDVTDDSRKLRLAEHIKKLQDRLKLLTMATGRRVVTWQPVNEGDVLTITEDILKELDDAEAVIEMKSGASKSHVASEDLRKLLLPANTYKIEGDRKQLEAKLESSASKLNSMTETITLSVNKPESLGRTAHLTAESAVQLAAIARAMKSDEDPAKNNKIEDASQELCFVTYNLLKTADAACQEPNNIESRRRLLDACRALNNAINTLVRSSSTLDKLQRVCNESARTLQLRVATLRPARAALSYAQVHGQHHALENLRSEKQMSREEFCVALELLTSSVCADVDAAEQCAYLLSISEQHPELAKEGLFDSARLQRLVAVAQDSCFRVTRSGVVDQAKEESSLISKQLSELKQAAQECSSKVHDPDVKKQLTDATAVVDATGMDLQAVLNRDKVSVDQLTAPAFKTIEALTALRTVTEHPSLTPQTTPSAQGQKRVDEVMEKTKELLTRAIALTRAVKTTENHDAMTWVMFNTYSKGVIEASEQLLTCVRVNGQNAGLMEGSAAEVDEEADLTVKSYVQTQVIIANKWLSKPPLKAQIKTDGETAARNVIDVGRKLSKHLKEAECDEMRHLADECEQLLAQCSARYNQETASLLMDRLKDLSRMVDRCVVSMVVEEFALQQEPLEDLEILVDAESDEAKRKYLLEKKIADLLAHLARVTKTATVVAEGHKDTAVELKQCSEQATLLAPMLVKAAEKRVHHPTETAVVENYQTQLAQYSASLSRVRDLCDRAVDPMQFVQAAEETMQRMKEESVHHQNDLEKCSTTSVAIKNLAHRVVSVGMWSRSAQRDPELMKALAAAQQRLRDAEPAHTLRPSKMPDWNRNIAEILRATGEVESVLGGEMIFKKQPEPNQPIYNAALNLHAAVREWSARDNEIVAVAKRMAVLMAKLSDYMHADKKREVISTSKAIVAASHEVARLARKLALECTDMRIRTNLLQVCDQIPTISGQLKMLTTVKGSSLGHLGTEEDIEAMNMLVGNAQNLMTSIQDVVNAAASASVKIRSQRGGPRIRWVRKNYH